MKEWRNERAAQQLAQKAAEVANKDAALKQEAQRQSVKIEKRQQAKAYREEKVDELA